MHRHNHCSQCTQQAQLQPHSDILVSSKFPHSLAFFSANSRCMGRRGRKPAPSAQEPRRAFSNSSLQKLASSPNEETQLFSPPSAHASHPFLSHQFSASLPPRPLSSVQPGHLSSPHLALSHHHLHSFDFHPHDWNSGYHSPVSRPGTPSTYLPAAPSCQLCHMSSFVGLTRSPSDGGEVRWFFSKRRMYDGGELSPLSAAISRKQQNSRCWESAQARGV